MKRKITLFTTFTTILSLFIYLPLTQSQEKSTPCPSWSVYFSPKGGCTEAIINELNQAKTSILVQAHSLTSAPIAKALLNAYKRGVKVEVILDKSQKREKYTEADFLVHALGYQPK